MDFHAETYQNEYLSDGATSVDATLVALESLT